MKIDILSAFDAKTHATLRRPIAWSRHLLLFAGLLFVLSPLAVAAQPDAPVFSVPSGVYATAQTVSITDATPGAKIFYTTNGTAPTTASIPYIGPIAVNSSTTLEAIAFVGNTPSGLSWVMYSMASGSPTDVFNFSQGFAKAQGPMQFNGSTAANGSLLELTNGGQNEAGSAFYATPVTIDQPFSTDFIFRLSSPSSSVPLSNIADGFTFTILSAEPYIVPAGSGALGGSGGALGFTGIENNAAGGYNDFDMAVKFDLYDNAGEGPNSTGLYVDGALPTVPAINLYGTGINLHSGHTFLAQVVYDGTSNLYLNLTDTETLVRWSQQFPVDIPKTIGSVIAYVGFTGGTGYLTAKQDILSWTYVSGNIATPNSPPSLPSLPDYPKGFNAVGIATNGSATLSGKSLSLTDGGEFEAGSAFYATPVTVDQPFTTNFNFRLSPRNSTASLANMADGFTFTIVSSVPYILPSGLESLGGNGGALGFTGIEGNTAGGYNNFDMAIKFDLYNNAGEGPNSTGLFVNDALPTVPAVDLTGTGIDLHSGHIFHAQMAYDGTANLALTLTDTETHATYSHTFAVDVPKTIGGVIAYIGFTGGTGFDTAKQDILSWTVTTP